MVNISFDKIVNKLLKKGGKVLFKNDIYEIIDPELKQEYSNYVDKLIYRLKSEGVILSIKSGVYIVPSDEDNKLNKIDLIEKYYLKLLKKYITLNTGASYYISGKKSLEFHLKNYEIPEKIFVVNRSINKKIKIGNHEIIFKTCFAKIEGKKQNIYSKLSSYVTNKEIDGLSFKIANLELSLIESAIISDSYEGIDISLLSKSIKKYSSVFDKNIFYELGKLKFSMSFNRLKELSKTIDSDLSQVFLDVIKKNGGLFIGEGLRGI